MDASLFMKGQFEACRNALIEKLRSKQGIPDISTSDILTQLGIRQNLILCEVRIAQNRKCGSHANEQLKAFEKLLLEAHGMPPSSETLLLQSCILSNWMCSAVTQSRVKECISTMWKWLMNILDDLCTLHIQYSSTFSNARSSHHVETILGWLLNKSDELNEAELLTIQITSSIASWILMWIGDVKSSLNVISFVKNVQEKCQDRINEHKFISRSIDNIEDMPSIINNMVFFNNIPMPVEASPRSQCTNVVLFTLFASYLANDNVDEALQTLELLNCEAWKPYLLYVKANLMYRKNDIKEARNIAWSLLESKGKSLEPWLKSRLCNIVGCALSVELKPNLAILWFSRAAEHGDPLVPLWNMALQFHKARKLGGVSETLALLNEVAARQDQKTVSDFPGILQLDPSQSREIDYVECLLFTARWYLHQRNFPEASSWYEKLLNELKDGCTLPNEGSMMLIHLEAAYAHLKCHKVQKCIDIANRALTCCSSEDFYPTSMKRAVDDTKSEEPMDVIEDINDFIPLIRKRNRPIDINEPSTSQQSAESMADSATVKSATTTMSVKNFLLMVRAAAHYHLQDITRSEEDLEKARGDVLEFFQMDDVSEEDAPNPAKRIRLEGVPANEDKYSAASKSACDLAKSQVYSNLAVISIQKGLWQDAVHHLRVALICHPGNWDAMFNYTLLLVKSNRTEQAKRTWCNAWKNQVGVTDFSVENIAPHIADFSVSREQIVTLHHMLDIS